MGRPFRYLVLLLTEACNLRCVYCYRGERRCARSMPREVAERSLQYIASSGHHFHVQITGGEPTLEPTLIEWIASLVREKGWPATIGIQTNGTNLDSSLLKVFKRYDVRVGVSLDGPPEVQEEVRGKAAGTFRGLQLLTEQEMDFRVTTVITDQTVRTMGQLALLLGRFPTARGLGLDLLVARGRALDGDMVRHPSSEELRNGLKRLLQALNWVNENRSCSVKLRELELLKQASLGQKSTLFCHAAKGEAMAVYPDGSVYPCAQTVGDPCFACGTIDAPDASGLDGLKGYRLESERCLTCPLEDFCPGDCPSRLHYNDARTGKLACVMYQTLWKEYRRSQG
ncbi:MAG: hypothetical protein B1H11_07310 [Desulfobacteraceae bacterium 4484_190.1]|nr:MAG: hypothetical protein B1H11_07310 [Desulfobacteraceae bacterium 4484_190.1]